jgi:hypothetical protein
VKREALLLDWQKEYDNIPKIPEHTSENNELLFTIA